MGEDVKPTFPCGHPRTKENSYICISHSPDCKICKRRRNKEAARKRVRVDKPVYPDRWETPLLAQMWK